jgi:hypothetical protein
VRTLPQHSPSPEYCASRIVDAQALSSLGWQTVVHRTIGTRCPVSRIVLLSHAVHATCSGARLALAYFTKNSVQPLGVFVLAIPQMRFGYSSHSPGPQGMPLGFAGSHQNRACGFLLRICTQANIPPNARYALISQRAMQTRNGFPALGKPAERPTRGKLRAG